MGEVWCAEDSRLGRRVAVKLLPQEWGGDEERRRRFEQEARAASALNHPNIVTVHDLGQQDGRYYMATELVEGETLRSLLESGALEPHRALEIARQVCEALGAAHRAGLVHRDLKPENLVVRPDGLVKVLDFGLAKLDPARAGGRGPGSDSSLQATATPTLPLVETSDGAVLGTVGYMSPEQARGLEVDHRTDLFALGVLLYEMLCGVRPFVGATRSDTLAALLTAEPLPLEERVAGLEPRVAWTVGKALRKDVEERYQSARELQSDLVAASTSSVSAESRPVTTVTSAEAEAEGEKSRLPGKLWLAAVVLVILAAALFVASRFGGSAEADSASEPFAAFEVQRLTASGRERIAVLSPDGRHVAHVSEGPEGFSLELLQVATGSSVRLLAPVPFEYRGLTFSRDGEYVYPVRYSDDVQRRSDLYRVATLGGAATRVLLDVDTAVAFSPDGMEMAFLRFDPDAAAWNLVVATVDAGEERIVAQRESPGFLAGAPTWSPDGKWLAAAQARSADAASAEPIRLGLVAVDGSGERDVTERVWGAVDHLDWHPDGRHLLVSGATEDTDFNFSLFTVALEDGRRRRLVQDLNSYFGADVSTDGRRLVSVSSETRARLQIARPGGGGRLEVGPPETGVFDGVYGVAALGAAPGAASTSGEVAHVRRDFELWLREGDGGQRRLGLDNTDREVAACGEDGPLVTMSWRNGGYRIYRVALDGSAPVALTPETMDSRHATCDAASSLLVFAGRDGGKWALFRGSLEGAQPEQLNHHECIWPSLHPGGEVVVALCRPTTFADQEIRLVDVASGELVGEPIVLPGDFDPVPDPPVRFTPDGGALLIVRRTAGSSDLWRYELDGGNWTRLTDFTDDARIRSFDLWPDGSFVLSRGHWVDDVVLLLATEPDGS